MLRAPRASQPAPASAVPHASRPVSVRVQAFKALTDMHKGQIKKHMYTFCVLLYAKILCLVGKRDFVRGQCGK